MTPAERLTARLLRARSEGRLALLPYWMAGYPELRGAEELCLRVAEHGDVLELGLAFSDPVADGPAIAAAGRRALVNGACFERACALGSWLRARTDRGLVLMSYLNPLLAVGLAPAVQALVAAGFEGLIVPDLPLEESLELRAHGDGHGLALVQLVTPLTPPDRARANAAASRGFLYAVTRAGTTGARADAAAVAGLVGRLRAQSPLPLCAGFGIRTREQVLALRGHCDGVVVGSALIDLLGRGEDPVPFLASLQAAAGAAGPSP